MLGKIKNMVFEGGGVKGSAYAGAIEVFCQQAHYENVKALAGASAGSITASILASGAGHQGLLESVEQTNFQDFVTDEWGALGDVERMLKHYGIHTGNGLVDILRGVLNKGTGNPDITFQQLNILALEDSKFKELYVVSTNLSTQRSRVFSKNTTPDLEVWKAVRASLSIPFIFEPMLIDGDYYVDGGLSWNYPIDLFDKQGDSFDETIGFFLEPHQEVIDGEEAFFSSNTEISSLKDYMGAMVNFMFNKANSAHVQQRDRARTIFIDDVGVQTANFGATKDKIEALIESGRTAMRDFCTANTTNG